MTKKDMLETMIDAGYYSLIVSSYMAEGYTPEGARRKTVEYYVKAMSKAEIKELYDDYVWTHTHY